MEAYGDHNTLQLQRLQQQQRSWSSADVTDKQPGVRGLGERRQQGYWEGGGGVQGLLVEPWVELDVSHEMDLVW